MENNNAISKKTYQKAVVFGRFNLLHRGHLALFEEMHSRADLVVIGLSTNEDNLPVGRRMKVIAKACDSLGINYVIKPAAQPFEVFAMVDEGLENSGPKPALAMFGEDQYKLAKAAERVYGWDSDVIPRLSSSTAIRALIDNEEWDVLSRLVPHVILDDVIALHLSTKN